MSSTKYQIEQIRTAAGVEALCEPWQQLVAQIPDLYIFMTWEWVNTWVRHMEPGWDLWILAARDAQGNLAGIAPWMRSSHGVGPLHVRRISFLGSSFFYRTHMDVIARSGERAEIFDAFMGHMYDHAREWDYIDLESLAEGSPVKERAASARGFLYEKEPVLCPYTSLPDRWESYELDKLSANRRQQLRARRRKIERDFPEVHFERVSTPEDLERGMDAVVELHRKRWHGREQRSSFDVESFEDFHREFARIALQRDWLRLYILWIGERPIAAEYCFLYNGVLFDYQKGFDPDPRWERYSPGQLIQAFAIQDAIREGAHEFDMARGTYEYKFSWTDSERVDSHILLSNSLRGHTWVLGGAAYTWARGRGAKLVPSDLRNKINRRLGGRRGGATATAVSSEDGPAEAIPGRQEA